MWYYFLQYGIHLFFYFQGSSQTGIYRWVSNHWYIRQNKRYSGTGVSPWIPYRRGVKYACFNHLWSWGDETGSSFPCSDRITPLWYSETKVERNQHGWRTAEVTFHSKEDQGSGVYTYFRTSLITMWRKRLTRTIIFWRPAWSVMDF